MGKGNGKGKGKGQGKKGTKGKGAPGQQAGQATDPLQQPKRERLPRSACANCGEHGHWKGECPHPERPADKPLVIKPKPVSSLEEAVDMGALGLELEMDCFDEIEVADFEALDVLDEEGQEVSVFNELLVSRGLVDTDDEDWGTH